MNWYLQCCLDEANTGRPVAVATKFDAVVSNIRICSKHSNRSNSTICWMLKKSNSYHFTVSPDFIKNGPARETSIHFIRLSACLLLPFPHSFFLASLVLNGNMHKRKSKAVPLQAWSGPEGSSKLRFPDFMTAAQDGGKVVSLTHRPPLPPGNSPGIDFC